MKSKVNKSDLPVMSQSLTKNETPQEYPLYLPEDDIYSKFKKEDLNPEDISKLKRAEKKPVMAKSAEKDLNDFDSDLDMDVPGSELDDEQEFIGGEDEENNYYSLGGDDHNNLDEDRDELY